MSEKEKKAASRRDFLKLASVSAPAAVATLAVSGTEAAAAPEDAKGSGLRDTAHTRAYLDSARF
ncbi:twin-arginine translocation pathway signal protein [Oceanibium sediminis]|uniref:twin-arginine translocation pathway signal protein n=1 Tax=Oceanibium sediminis TaxID=2026339 RepID=UPI000DD3C46A|nr:twin-arginine translocation pathway signal protein [Oceanibium sediminis]